MTRTGFCSSISLYFYKMYLKLYCRSLCLLYVNVFSYLSVYAAVQLYVRTCIIMILRGLCKPPWLGFKALLANFIQWPFMALKKPLRPHGRHLQMGHLTHFQMAPWPKNKKPLFCFDPKSNGHLAYNKSWLL